MAVGLWRDKVQNSVIGVTKLTCRIADQRRNKLPWVQGSKEKSLTPHGRE
jgi:hypothetical protein